MFNETYSIAFIAFAVLEEMLVQMYNWSLCIQHKIKCTFVFKGNLCTLIKVTQFRIQLTVCECCLLVETCIFMYLVYTEYIDHPLRIYLFFISFLRFGLPMLHNSWQPHFPKGLTKLAILPDYKRSGLICLALPACQKFGLILVIKLF